MTENILKQTGPGVLCKVCGDRASGKHYGVPSCDGCRGFFKRSIRRNLEYICKEGGKCIVDVSRRNQCQACRFSKCLQANMRREAVQHERAPRSQQMPINGITMDMYSTPRRLPSLTPSGLFLPMPMHIPTIDTNRYFPSFQGGMLDPLQLGNGVFMPPKINTNYLNTSLRSSPGNNSSGKDDEVTSSEETQNINFTNLRTNFKKEAIFESAAKLLFLAVKWARSVPSFSQLPVRDQTILLEESWAELFVITAAQWGLTIDNEFLSNEPGWKNLQRAINKFVGMRIDQTEAACLKALTLFKPDSLGLLSCHQIASLQDQTLSLLSEKCGGVRLGHILLILPVVKTAANPQLLQEMLFKTTVGEVAIERLLGDLMKT